MLPLSGVLLWCVYFTGSPIVTVAIFVLIAAIFALTRDRIAAIWRQTLVLEDDRLVYFDGQMRHEFLIAEIQLIRVTRWSGNFRLRQNEGHSLALLPLNGEIKYWDFSDFSLKVVLRLVCELARRADWPPIEIHQTEFQSLNAELHQVVSGLGTLSSLPLDDIDETTLSFYEKAFRERERRYLFTPHR